MPAICHLDTIMNHVTDLIPCRQQTQFSLQRALDNYHIVAWLLRCSRHIPMVWQYELPGMVCRPLQLILIRDHLDLDWHTQEHQPPLCGYWPLANNTCNLQEDGVNFIFWSYYHQAALLGVH